MNTHKVGRTPFFHWEWGGRGTLCREGTGSAVSPLYIHQRRCLVIQDNTFHRGTLYTVYGSSLRRGTTIMFDFHNALSLALMSAYTNKSHPRARRVGPTHMHLMTNFTLDKKYHKAFVSHEAFLANTEDFFCCPSYVACAIFCKH